MRTKPARRLVAIPGIGPVTATAIIAAIGNGGAYKGREFAACMGVNTRCWLDTVRYSPLGSRLWLSSNTPSI
jgi:hypothetical protein